MIYFFISLIFINLFLYYKNYIFLVFVFTGLFLLGKLVNLKLFCLCCVGICLFTTFNFNYYKHDVANYNFDSNVVILENYSNYSIVGDNKNKYVIYNNDNNFRVGNEIWFKGKLINIEDSYNEFYNYLNKNNVCYELEYEDFIVIDNSVKLNEVIIDKLLENKSEQSKSYLKLILFNDKDENNIDFYNTFSIYSLTYLIAVSGFHISLLLSFFKKIFHNNIIGLVLVSFYLYLLDFSVSSYRAFLCYIFKKINKRLGFCISNIEIISLIGSVFLICNPSIMFSMSFVYSFLAAFVLEIFKLYKSGGIKITLYLYLINIPILLVNYYKLNVSSLLFSVILSKPVAFLYVFSFMFLFLDKFYLLYELVIKLFTYGFEYLNELNLILIFGRPSIIFIISYYLVLIYFFLLKESNNKLKYACVLMLFLLLGYQYYKPVINSNEQIYFINVGQGDCIAFFVPNSKEVVLVDTGGSKYKDIALKEIIPFLESKGINRIRNVILTHDDYDHVGALKSLRDNFIVDSVIDTSYVEEIIIGNKIFKNLNISEHRDNDGSIVLYGEYAGYDLLLMGDASISIEKEILKHIENVDIIKIGHHGSDTSSSYEFLDIINGKIAIISVGKNSYGHPHKSVIKSLEKLEYIILRTDKNNDIGFGKNIFGLSFVDYFN